MKWLEGFKSKPKTKSLTLSSLGFGVRMINQRIKEANGRLAANNWGIRIEMIRRRLWLRGVFPPKPKAANKKWHQQRISIAPANADGVKIAEAAAKAAAIRLAAKTFDWGDYLKPEPGPLVIGDWVSDFERDYWERREKNYKSLSTWNKDYWDVFKHLPMEEELTPGILQKLIFSTKPDTRTRRKYAISLGALARFACLKNFDSRNFVGRYSSKSRIPRKLPTDKQIVDFHDSIESSKWRWVFGILATYGLRNHEVFFLDLQELRDGNHVLTVMDGKTGPRRVWPFHPEWVEQFYLSSVKLPQINLERDNSAIGHAVTQHFRRNAGLLFQVYDLRHAWAVRSLEYGIDISLAAQQMGHSLTVHSSLYHSWITARVHQQAFENAIGKSDRPRPPKV
ncbi:tyrosine-type recombinase/integrase [Nodularia spumigena]|uniref:tyrosine-type recombinase/integrase n=1 Tax=Nodularia spumigena TaxID=70799 RepID=UPI00232BD5D3|nr:site-specific integrase [Nodularia spumigena]MDB9349019.1 site-specific integrase [Nodularia spumigena CS-588/01]MDB9352487.1 site-specific integrase [Nodularia spumigena CS-588/05]